MADYPLVFKLTYEIPCANFSAKVVIQGRALMVFEDGEWWCHGVEPGGLTEHGEQPAPAFAAFKSALGQILIDLADDAGTFENFVSAVKGFVADKDATETQRWDAARREIREGKPVEVPFNAMKREHGEAKSWAAVVRLEQIEPAEEQVLLAEAA